MADESSRNGEPVGSDRSRLADLRHRLHEAEADLRARGYRVERCVAHPGSEISNQIFTEEILILLLSGRLRVRSEQETSDLGAGDPLHVPPGVPFALTVRGESTAYWLQGFRREAIPDRDSGTPSK